MIGCDLGSNTLRIVQMDCQTHERIKSYEKIVRTAKDLHTTGLVGEVAKTNIFTALHEASKLFDFHNEACFCVTTEAMRVAQNGQTIINEIEKTFGLSFEIITGEKEAYLTSLAVENALKREGYNPKTYALFDLGGGSTEVILCKNGTKKVQSFPFGIVTTADKLNHDLSKNVAPIVEIIDPFLKNEHHIVADYMQLVTTAGTPTTVASFLQGVDYEHYDANRVNGKILNINDFQTAYELLTTMPPQEAERFTGTNRRDLVIIGILLVQNIMQKLGFKECIVIDDGLREGVVLEQCYNFRKS